MNTTPAITLQRSTLEGKVQQLLQVGAELAGADCCGRGVAALADSWFSAAFGGLFAVLWEQPS